MIRNGLTQGKLGIFDSGLGGLTVVSAIHQILPSLSLSYLGDNARAPYGTRSEEEIFTFTWEGVRTLFEGGCPLVILACNTASAGALRRIQQELLPVHFPDRRVLGIIIPTIEAVAHLPTRAHIAVFATTATVASHAYKAELARLRPDMRVSEIACPALVPLIESGLAHSRETDASVAAYTKSLLDSAHPDAIILGCTHYPVIQSVFEHYANSIPVYSQGTYVAHALSHYLERHADIRHRLRFDAIMTYATSGDPEYVSVLARTVLGKNVAMRKQTIGA